jgi:biotin synthase
MNEQMQALAFLAGANSIFYGEKLLTTPNPAAHQDQQLFAKLGINPHLRAVPETPSMPAPEHALFYDACA